MATAMEEDISDGPDVVVKQQHKYGFDRLIKKTRYGRLYVSDGQLMSASELQSVIISNPNVKFQSCEISQSNWIIYNHRTGTHQMERGNIHSTTAAHVYVKSNGIVNVYVPHRPCCPYFHVVVIEYQQKLYYKPLVETDNVFLQTSREGKLINLDLFGAVKRVVTFIRSVPFTNQMESLQNSLNIPIHVQERLHAITDGKWSSKVNAGIVIINEWKRGQKENFCSAFGLRLDEEIVTVTNSLYDPMTTDVIDGVIVFNQALFNVYTCHIETEADNHLKVLVDNFVSRKNTEMTTIVGLTKVLTEYTTNKKFVQIFHKIHENNTGHLALQKDYATPAMDVFKYVVDALTALHNLGDRFSGELKIRLEKAFSMSDRLMYAEGHANDKVDESLHLLLRLSSPESKKRELQEPTSYFAVKNVEFTLYTYTSEFYTRTIHATLQDTIDAIETHIDSTLKQINMHRFKQLFAVILQQVKLIVMITDDMPAICLYNYLNSVQTARGVSRNVLDVSGRYVLKLNFDDLQTSTSISGTQTLGFLRKNFTQLNDYKENLLVATDIVSRDYTTWSDNDVLHHVTKLQGSVRGWTKQKLDLFHRIFVVILNPATFISDVLEKCHDMVNTVVEGNNSELGTALIFTQVYERLDVFVFRRLGGVINPVRNGYTVTHHLVLMNAAMVVSEVGASSDVNGDAAFGVVTIGETIPFETILKTKLNEIILTMKRGNASFALTEELDARITTRYQTSLLSNKDQKLYWSLDLFWLNRNIIPLMLFAGETLETNHTWKYSRPTTKRIQDEASLSWWAGTSAQNEAMFANYVKLIHRYEYFEDIRDVNSDVLPLKEGVTFSYTPANLLQMYNYTNPAIFPTTYLNGLCKWWDNSLLSEAFMTVQKRYNSAIGTLNGNVNTIITGILRESNLEMSLALIYNDVCRKLDTDSKDTRRDRYGKWWNFLLYVTSMGSNHVGAKLLQFANKLILSFYMRYDETSNTHRVDNNAKRSELFCNMLEERANGNVKLPLLRYGGCSDDGDASFACGATYDTAAGSKDVISTLIRSNAASIADGVVNYKRTISAGDVSESNRILHEMSFNHGVCTELIDRSIMAVSRPVGGSSTGERANVNLIFDFDASDDTYDTPSSLTIPISRLSQRTGGLPDEYTGAYQLLYADSITDASKSPRDDPGIRELVSDLTERYMSDDHTVGKKSRYSTVALDAGLSHEFNEIKLLNTTVPTTTSSLSSPQADFLNTYLIDAVLTKRHTVLDLIKFASDGTDAMNAFNSKLGQAVCKEGFSQAAVDSTKISCFTADRACYVQTSVGKLTDYMPAYLTNYHSDNGAKLRIGQNVYANLSVFKNVYQSVKSRDSDSAGGTSNETMLMLNDTVDELLEQMSLSRENFDEVETLLMEKLQIFANARTPLGVITVDLLSDMMRPEFWSYNYVKTLIELRSEWSSQPNVKRLLFGVKDKSLDRKDLGGIGSSSVEEESRQIRRQKTLTVTWHGEDMCELVDLNLPIEIELDNFRQRHNIPGMPLRFTNLRVIDLNETVTPIVKRSPSPRPPPPPSPPARSSPPLLPVEPLQQPLTTTLMTSATVTPPSTRTILLSPAAPQTLQQSSSVVPPISPIVEIDAISDRSKNADESFDLEEMTLHVESWNLDNNRLLTLITDDVVKELADVADDMHRGNQEMLESFRQFPVPQLASPHTTTTLISKYRLGDYTSASRNTWLAPKSVSTRIPEVEQFGAQVAAGLSNDKSDIGGLFIARGEADITIDDLGPIPPDYVDIKRDNDDNDNDNDASSSSKSSDDEGERTRKERTENEEDVHESNAEEENVYIRLYVNDFDYFTEMMHELENMTSFVE